MRVRSRPSLSPWRLSRGFNGSEFPRGFFFHFRSRGGGGGFFPRFRFRDSNRVPDGSGEAWRHESRYGLYKKRSCHGKRINLSKMADDFTVVRFSTTQNSAQIEGINEYKKDDYVKSFKEMELGRFYIVTILLSVVTFILDLYFHCWIAYVYYIEKEGDYFVLTLVFLVVPALVTTAFSMRW